ncbi:hypothetical protein Tco_0394822 [Tanacetum coccineum]
MVVGSDPRGAWGCGSDQGMVCLVVKPPEKGAFVVGQPPPEEGAFGFGLAQKGGVCWFWLSLTAGGCLGWLSNSRVNADGFNSDIGYDDETSTYRRRRQKFGSSKEAKDRLYMHSIESKRKLKQYKNDKTNVRAICEGKLTVFTMLRGSGPTGPNQTMGDGPSRSSGLTTRSTNRKDVGTNDDSEACSSVVDARDKGDLYPWVLYVALEVQDQLQHNLELQVSMKKESRAKFKSEREVKGLAKEKGSFPCQVLAAIGLDSKNGIYPLAYALVEAESKSSLSWFLQCLGDGIDLQLNSNFAFINDRQKCVVDVVARTCRKWELTEIHYKHDVAAC